jgi:hypothetical protein
MSLRELLDGVGLDDAACRFAVLGALGLFALVVLFFVGLGLDWWPAHCPGGVLRWWWQGRC